MERRLSAVVISDVVGFSRLMEADETGTLATLKERRRSIVEPVVAAHGGRIVKEMGDGLLMEFPSAVGAMAGAIELQLKTANANTLLPADRHVVLRIGISLGEVVVEGADIFGEEVNIAARLETLAEPGGICISSKVHDEVRRKVEAGFEDLGELSLKNISRPVRAYQLRPRGAAPRAARMRTATNPEKASIAVLPFQNMSGDPEQEYFADGLVDDIITGLSRIRWLFVIARNSSFIYKGQSVDVRQVGSELGVRYVVEGGVQKAGSRIRITAQLLDARSGAHLWAEKYDGTIEDVFDLQDRITDRVVGIVEPNVQRSEIERSRRKRPENLDAYDLYLRAVPHVTAHMPKDIRIALPLLRQALEFDPEYAAAHALIAWCHELCFTRAGFAEADRSAALSHARVAIASNTDDAATLAIAGFVMSMLVKHGSRDHQAALAAIRRALSHNPSCATALYLGAQASAIAGRLDDAKTFAQRALLLSPFDPLVFEAQMALGETALQEERYDDAAAFFAEAAHANSDFSTAYFFEAIALALLGRMPEAQALADRATKLEPGVGARLFTEHGGINEMLLRPLLSGAQLLRL